MKRFILEGILPGAVFGCWVVSIKTLFVGLFLASVLIVGALYPTWNSAQKARRSLAVGIDSQLGETWERVLRSLCEEVGVKTPQLIVVNPKKKGQVYAAVVGTSPAMIVGTRPLFERPLLEVKGVLLHELGHIHYAHLLKRRILNISMIYLSVLILWASLPDLSSPLLFGLALVLFCLRVFVRVAYEHFNEYQADQFSHRLLPGAFREFLATQEEGSSPLSWFSTHPDSRARISALH